jgi:hypothetical protein
VPEDEAGRSRAPQGSCGFLSEDGRAALQQRRPGTLPFAADGTEAELVRAVTRDHHEIDAVRDEVRPRAETLATDALDAVALHGIADLSRDHDAETRGSAIIGRRRARNEQNEMSARRTLTFRLHSEKVRAALDASFGAEREAQLAPLPFYFA